MSVRNSARAATIVVAAGGRALTAAPCVSLRRSVCAGSFAGATLAPGPVSRGGLLVMANNKKSIGCTKEGTNRCGDHRSGRAARRRWDGRAMVVYTVH